MRGYPWRRLWCWRFALALKELFDAEAFGRRGSEAIVDHMRRRLATSAAKIVTTENHQPIQTAVDNRC